MIGVEQTSTDVRLGKSLMSAEYGFLGGSRAIDAHSRRS